MAEKKATDNPILRPVEDLPETLPDNVLRIIHVNDVYKLEGFAQLETICKRYRTKNSVLTHGGDFLSPYLLASIDHGKAMIKMMNAVKFDFAIFGNHEADLKLPQLYRRIKESTFAWVNSNMPDFIPPEGALPRYLVKKVGGKKVAFIGVVTEKEDQYKKGRFNGVPILNANDTAVALKKELLDKGMDYVVCLTHQNMPEDRALCSTGEFPLILGGHEHELYHEIHNCCRILKVGENIDRVGIIDITLPEENCMSNAKVEVTVLNSADFPADEAMANNAATNGALLTSLMKTTLLPIPDGVVLTAKDARMKPNQLASLIATSRKDVLGTDCAFFHGGGVRGGNDYKGNLTLASLLEVMPFSADIGRCMLPGRVINEMIKFSRIPKEAGNPAFLHCDKYMEFGEDGNIVEINMKPFDPDQIYAVGLDKYLLGGGNGIKPLNDYMQEAKPEIMDGAHDMSLTVTYFCDLFWLKFAQDTMEATEKKSLTMEDVKEHLRSQHHMNSEIPDIMAELFMSAADLNNDGVIDQDEVHHMLKFHENNLCDLFQPLENVHHIICKLTRRSTILTPTLVDKRYRFTGRFSYALLPDLDTEEKPAQ